jgi:hypothetical protein
MVIIVTQADAQFLRGVFGDGQDQVNPVDSGWFGQVIDILEIAQPVQIIDLGFDAVHREDLPGAIPDCAE